jgi:protein involved in polysaccharide export with SLBB domain
MLIRPLALALLLPLSSCQACQEAPTTGYEELNREIGERLSKVGLGPGDVFEVTVYGEDKLSGTHRIAPDGAIQFPLVNRVVVDGMTASEIADELRRRLQDGFLREPSVSVFVKEYGSKKVFVLGEVARPGTFPFTAEMNIVEAITLAGGFKDSARTNYVIVTRQTPDGERRIPVPVEKITEGIAQNLRLQPGDIVFVPDTLL